MGIWGGGRAMGCPLHGVPGGPPRALQPLCAPPARLRERAGGRGQPPRHAAAPAEKQLLLSPPLGEGTPKRGHTTRGASGGPPHSGGTLPFRWLRAPGSWGCCPAPVLPVLRCWRGAGAVPPDRALLLDPPPGALPPPFPGAVSRNKRAPHPRVLHPRRLPPAPPPPPCSRHLGDPHGAQTPCPKEPHGETEARRIFLCPPPPTQFSRPPPGCPRSGAALFSPLFISQTSPGPVPAQLSG